MKNHILKPPTFTLIMLLSIQPVKIPEKITVFFLIILVESSIFSAGRAKTPKNGVLIQQKIYLHINIFQFYQLALLSMISSIVWRKKIMITSAVFIRYEMDKNFDEFWHWLIYSWCTIKNDIFTKWPIFVRYSMSPFAYTNPFPPRSKTPFTYVIYLYSGI